MFHFIGQNRKIHHPIRQNLQTVLTNHKRTKLVLVGIALGRLDIKWNRLENSGHSREKLPSSLPLSGIFFSEWALNSIQFHREIEHQQQAIITHPRKSSPNQNLLICGMMRYMITSFFSSRVTVWVMMTTCRCHFCPNTRPTWILTIISIRSSSCRTTNHFLPTFFLSTSSAIWSHNSWACLRTSTCPCLLKRLSNLHFSPKHIHAIAQTCSKLITPTDVSTLS